jgi:hypothetical protein
MRLLLLHDLISAMIKPSDQAVGHGVVPTGIRSGDDFACRKFSSHDVDLSLPEFSMNRAIGLFMGSPAVCAAAVIFFASSIFSDRFASMSPKLSPVCGGNRFFSLPLM